MTTLAEQKSQLAKLMATENVTVEHSKIKTAMFDTKNRVLYLPIWKDMTGYIYDLLGGHEVGHALYTPPEGWHNAATDKSKGKNYKSFLNVLEDARIEKKIKRKYPGLRSSFVKAYNSLFERNFFGIMNMNVNELPFIDRLNIFTKSQYTADYIEFSPEEQPFIKKVLELETWEDVIRLTDEIYDYSKDEQLSLHQFDDLSFDEYNPETDEYESSDDYDASESQSGESSDGEESDDSVDGDSKNEKESSSPSLGSDEDTDEETKVESESNKFNRQKESSTVDEDQYDPVCTTDDIYRENEMLLVDDRCKDYVYVNLPKPNLENCITPAKRVHELLSTHYSKEIYSDEWKETASKLVNDFKFRNERYISLLAKEFEMRKAAKAYSKSKISETGDLNISKLATYKFDDNIFRKIVQVPKGKSHGLVLLLDRSGSMSSNMAGSIEQILVLAMFCRKVNIPFVVYGFGDAEGSRLIDLGDKNIQLKNVFEQSHMTLNLSNVYLREYLNSKMSNSEFSKAVYNMILLKSSYENSRFFGRPSSEGLSNTPLTQAIIALAPIMNQFRKVNNLDITNLVVVHDGDADDTCTYLKKYQYTNGVEALSERAMYKATDVIFIRDAANKFESKLDFDQPGNQVFYAVMKWFKHVTKSKVFGFYISSSPANAKTILSNHYVTKNNKFLWQKRNVNFDRYKQELSELMSKFKSEKFLANKTNNFDEFYFVVGGNELKTDDEEFEFDGKVTSSKLKNAFMKFNKKKVVNRVLVSRFIQGIAV